MQKINYRSVGLDSLREPYESPRIDAEIIELESGIATSSAATRPTDRTGEIYHEWEVGTDRVKDIDW